MGKPNRKDQAPQNQKSKPSKNKNKNKTKQMLPELKTHEENKIHQLSTKKHNNSSINPEQMNDDYQQMSYDSEMVVEDAKKQQDVSKICDTISQLMAKNKINSKNAFDVPFIDIENMPEFKKVTESQNGWRRISSTLQNDSKIYSYRVEAFHTIAYKIINTISRNQQNKGEAEVKQEGGAIIKQQGQSRVNRFDLRLPIIQETDPTNLTAITTHIQKNISNLNLQILDRPTEFNPTYQRTRRNFDQNGLKGMLLVNIKIDNNLQLALSHARKTGSTGLYSNIKPIQVKDQYEPLQLFNKGEEIRKKVSQVTGQLYLQSFRLEHIYRNIQNGQFQENEDFYENQQRMDIENDDRIQKAEINYKKIQDAIKLKNKKQKQSTLKSAGDIAQDGLSWLTDLDKRMLGLGGTSTLKKPVMNISTRPERNEDDIDFTKDEQLTKKDVFTEDTIQRNKGEWYQQIEQKHLLPLKMFNKFKVQQIMSLREQPLAQFIPQELEEQYIHIQQMERQQIDMKRQQMSIRQSKQKLKNMMAKTMDFHTLCNKFDIRQKNVTPELCFLTVLHLANENNLKLEQKSQFNFVISS